jgi:hypothetical protein
MKISLDWSAINNDKVFQRLSNHLFQFEVNRTYFIPSSPYVGADGGWDGRWNGVYADNTGLFSIQAKFTTKDHDDAKAYLDKEIKKELKKAKNQKVNHLIITTNANLRVNHITDLEALKIEGINTLQIWHREKLELLLYEHFFLCNFYFEKPQYPAFIPPDFFFKEDQEMLFLKSLLGRDAEIDSMINKIKSSKVSIIHAPGGHGKSHFLDRLAQKLDENSNSQILCVRLFMRDMHAAVQEELSQTRSFILIVDDADRAVEDFRKLIGIAKSVDSIKVVAACRSSGVPILEQEVDNQRISQYTINELAALDDEILKELLLKSSGKDKLDRIDEIIEQLDRVPYLIVQYGRSIQGKLTPVEVDQLKKNLVQLIAHDAKGILTLILPNPNDQTELLTHLSALVPFYKTPQLLETLSEIIKQDKRIIDQALEELLNAKILRRIGRSLRFYPDMSGDLFLADAVSEKIEIVDNLLSCWVESHPENIISNLTSAVPYDDSTAINQVLNKLVNSWIEKAENEDWYLHNIRIQLLLKIVRFAPEPTLNLLYTYLDLHKDIKDKYSRLNLDNYGPLITILGTIPQFNIKALQFIRKSIELKLEHTYQNYVPSELVKGLVRPTRIHPALIEDILKEIITSLETENPDDITLSTAVAAASEILAGAHEYNHSTPTGITIGSQCVSNTPIINSLRDLGIKIFQIILSKKGCLNYALEIAEDIGKVPFANSPERLPLYQRIIEDRQTVIGDLSKLDLNRLDITNLSRLEDALARWWLTEVEGTERVADLLMRINRSTFYLLIRHWIPSNYLIYDFAEILAKAPKSNRWKWWCNNKIDRTWSHDESDFADLVRMLSDEYTTKEQLKCFFEESSDLIKKLDAKHNPPIISLWVHTAPQLFIDFISSYGKDSVPDVFRGQVISAITKYQSESLSDLIVSVNDSLSNLPWENFISFMKTVTDNDVDYKLIKETFIGISQKASIDIRSRFLHLAYFYFLKSHDSDSYAEIILSSIHGELNGLFVQNLCFALGRFGKDGWPIPNKKLMTKLRKRVSPLLIELKQIDFDANRLASFSCQKNIDAYIRLLELRMAKAKTGTTCRKSRSEYEVISFDGFSCISSGVTSYSDFSKIMDKIISWEGEKLWHFDLMYLMKSILPLKDKGDSYYLHQWMLVKLREKNEPSTLGVIWVAGLMEFESLTEEIYTELFCTALEVGVLEEAKKIFYRLLTSGGFSCTVGQVPKVYLDKKQVCENLKASAPPGKLKAFFEEMVNKMEETIEDHRAEAEEILHPKD